MKLSLKQTKAIDLLEDKVTKELLFGGGAGGGKSILGCYFLQKCSLKYPGTRWVMGRASLKTLKETTLNSFFTVANIQGLKSDIHFRYNENRGLIKFMNGSEILLKDLELYPSDPNFDELGSLEITGAFVDECNQVVLKAWNVLRSRIRYKLDEYGLIPKMLGTCNPSKGWPYTRFYMPSRNGTLPKDMQFIQSLLTDNQEISQHYRENLLGLDKASIERLLHGNWDYEDDPSVLCLTCAIMDLFVNDHVKGGEKSGSADLAMKGRDRFIGGSWDGGICTIRLDKVRASGKEIETDLKNMMIQDSIPRSRMIVDSDGMGAYLESYLKGIREFHGGQPAFDKKEYANIKAECGWKLAEKINKREIKIVCTDAQQERIIEELGVLKQDKIDGDETRKRLIKKEEMKELINRSPDYLDMLIMSMWIHVKPKAIQSIDC